MLKSRQLIMKMFFGLLVSLTAAFVLMGCANTAGQKENGTEPANTDAPAQTQEAVAATADNAENLTINISELSATPKFFSAEANGTKMGVVALVASDGTVRTAFNTCQVCYSSGRGYYEAEGDELVCQNCGNRFSGDAVGVQSGGCNPVPITEKYRTEQDGVITIPGALLSEASVIFENWK